MATKKKSSFYHTRIRIAPNKDVAAEVLGCSVADIEMFDLEGAPIAERLLRLWDRKYVGVPGWDGWLFSRGVLRFKNQQWRPEDLLLLRSNEERVFKLENDLICLYSIYGLLKIFKFLILKSPGVLTQSRCLNTIQN